MVQSGDFVELSVLLSPPELAPLKPLLLLLAWDRYSDRGSGSELLETLWPDQVRLCVPKCRHNTVLCNVTWGRGPLKCSRMETGDVQ